jgi:predicted aspartyl protease
MRHSRARGPAFAVHLARDASFSRSIARVRNPLLPALLLSLTACESGPDYGPYTPLVRSQLQRLTAEPCNEAAIFELVDLMTKGQRPQDAIAPMKAFAAACEESDAFLDVQIAAGTRAKDWPFALEAADKRVNDGPSQRQPRLDRASVRRDAGDSAGAARDLRQAWLIDPRGTTDDRVKELAELQELAGQPCEAWQTWRSIFATRRDLRGEAQLKLKALQKDPACAGWRVEGESTVKREESEGWFLFPVKLDGKATRLGADTSAAVTVISEETATALGIPLDGEPWFVKSFQGVVAGPMVRVDALQIGDLTVKGVDVVVLESLPDKLPGMLGGDVLSRVRLTEEKGVLWKVEEW